MAAGGDIRELGQWVLIGVPWCGMGGIGGVYRVCRGPGSRVVGSPLLRRCVSGAKRTRSVGGARQRGISGAKRRRGIGDPERGRGIGRFGRRRRGIGGPERGRGIGSSERRRGIGGPERRWGIGGPKRRGSRRDRRSWKVCDHGRGPCVGAGIERSRLGDRGTPLGGGSA